MILGPIFIGSVAAVLVFFTRYFYSFFPGLIFSPPLVLLGLALAGVVLQKWIFQPKRIQPHYDGLADLFYQIHSPFKPQSALQWAIRGSMSFLLILAGAGVGAEGVAIEALQSLHMKLGFRSSLWFEQSRRTDAAVSLSAGISAAFGAPFAGVLLPIELGIGGSTISSVFSSFSAFLVYQFLVHRFSMESFNILGVLGGFHFTHWQEWLGIIVIGVLGGLSGSCLIVFNQYVKQNIRSLFQERAGVQILVCSILLGLIFFVYRSGGTHPLPPDLLLEQVLWGKISAGHVLLLCFGQGLILTLILAGFGTVGLFWPLFALGGYLGFCVNHWFFNDFVDFTAAAGLMGGSAIWATVLGAPVAGAILAYEVSQNIHVILPSLIVGLLACSVRRVLKVKTLVESDLMARGMSLFGGRSTAVLKSILVQDAMVTDFEIIHEKETISELHRRLSWFRYPFLPVVNTQGLLTGLLTVDSIQKGDEGPSLPVASALVELVEAKDLLYRSGFKPPIVRVNETLLKAAEVFGDFPCLPIVDDEGRIVGLLFGYTMRAAYDREVARRSFSFMREGGNGSSA